MEYTRYIYNPINWLNKSESLATPLGKTNLNHMESGIYNIAENLDVVYNEMSTGKFDKSDASKVITGMPTWNPNTGVLTFRFYDGTVFQVDFNVEKIPVSFSMDSAGVITMTTSDGTQWTADIGDVIPTYTFKDTDTIAFFDEKNGDYVHTVSAQIKKGSITGDYLQPNYLNDVTIQANNAKASAKNAKEYEDNAAYDAKLAQSYAVGGSGIREGENEDCAKAYKEKAELAAEEAGGYLADLQSVQVTGVKGNSETTYRKGNVNITPANIGLGSVGNYKAVSTVASQGLTDTEKNNARSNIGAAPTSHASTATTYGVSTAANYGHAMASSTVPKANGTATAGSETAKFARGDHVHPLQTSVTTATKATQDGNGKVIASTYLPLAGSTMTGNLGFNTDKKIVFTRGYSNSNEKSWIGSGGYLNCIIFNVGDFALRYTTPDGNYATLEPWDVTNVDLGGGGSRRFRNIYAQTGTIQTSDLRLKKDIHYIGNDENVENEDTYISDSQIVSLIMGIQPIVYKFIDNTSDRPHHGIGAQDFEDLLLNLGIQDHAALIKSPKIKEMEIENEIEDLDTGKKKIIKELYVEEIPGEYEYSLRYEEFIADIIRFIQIQKIREDTLEERLTESEKKCEVLEKRVEDLEKLLT